MSAETITAVGLSFPIGWWQKSDYMLENGEKLEDEDGNPYGSFYQDWVQTGIQGAVKVRHVFDNRFVLGADLEIGASTMRIKGEKEPDKWIDLNFDLAIGYAIVNNERFTLIASAIIGLHHEKQSYKITNRFYKSSYSYLDTETYDGTNRFTAFEYGGELFANFKVGNSVGIFASCKFVNNFGKRRKNYTYTYEPIYNFKEEYKWDYEYKKTTVIGIRPSIGVSFAF